MPLINPSISAKSKMKAETRAMDAASGNVAYTGYGFTPHSLIILSRGGPGGGEGTLGFGFATDELAMARYSTAAVSFVNDKLVYMDQGAGARQSAIIASFDADGFTLTWTKDGGPTADVADLFVMAFG